MIRMTVLSASRVPRIVGANFNDPTNERLIWLSAAGLVVVGLALLVGTIVWWRRGKQEHPSLAPLEVLGSRTWTRAGETDRRRKLDRVRIGGVAVPEEEPLRPEPVDLRELVRNMPAAFDDLRDPVPEPALVDGEPAVAPVDEHVVWAVSADGEAQPSGETAAVDADATSFIARPVGNS
jgi:hypothetical protein